MGEWVPQADGSVRYRGEWIMVEIHPIEGAWFMSCKSLRLDCIQLRAETLEAAKLEGVKIAGKMCSAYRKEIAQARFALPDDGFGVPKRGEST